MRLFIAIDGACRRNGKPDCTASGGVFIQDASSLVDISQCAVKSVYEYGSTNQRGELLALLMALKVVLKSRYETQIVTDSEYLFNAMTKQWYNNWLNNDWKTRDGSDVKNKDIWELIAQCANVLEREGIEVIYYHIKGHCIPFGAVTARKALEEDPTGKTLHKLVCEKFDAVAPTKADVFKYASDLSIKNNGFDLPSSSTLLKSWVTANVVADAIATKAVDDADSRRET